MEGSYGGFGGLHDFLDKGCQHLRAETFLALGEVDVAFVGAFVVEETDPALVLAFAAEIDDVYADYFEWFVFASGAVLRTVRSRVVGLHPDFRSFRDGWGAHASFETGTARGLIAVLRDLRSW